MNSTTYIRAKCWDYIRDYSTKYSLISFKNHITAEETAYFMSKSRLELFLYGAKEALKLYPIYHIQQRVLQEILELNANYKRWAERSMLGHQDILNNHSLKMIFYGYAIAGPICEELSFRGVIQRGMTRFHPRHAMIASHLIFAAIHQSPQTINILLFFNIQSLLYYKTRSIWASLGSHMANNACVVGPLVFEEYFKPLS
jgi:membrane protease YdiL (CAAX protease family)